MTLEFSSKAKKPKSFKDHELFSQLKIPPGVFFVIRCDGRSFKEVCSKVGFKKPFDKAFAELMVSSSKAVFEGGLNPLFTFIHSDEASFLFNGESTFKRRVEKLLSIVPSLMSSKASLGLHSIFNYNGPVSFDARVVLLDKAEIADYFAWRQMEAWRNHINSYAYYTLLSKGLTPREASLKLKGLKAPQLHELVFKEAGVNLATTPPWQRRGIALIWEEEVKEGFDPVKGAKVKALRLQLKEDWSPPIFASSEGRGYIERSMEARLRGVTRP
ncbi:MAG: tRNA 5'-guanylyltransferase [Thermoprotei archaeon]|nr:MAG: tRNA 5'-guanylyltransferase [Thermoprotei archaeon]RLF17426.1 MAG: tRNA 5'-guanylyltransferase [Thermoprotei archaeon]